MQFSDRILGPPLTPRDRKAAEPGKAKYIKYAAARIIESRGAAFAKIKLNLSLDFRAVSAGVQSQKVLQN